MKRKIILWVSLMLSFCYTSVSAGSSVDTYYVGNAVECKYTRYICESGYKSFSNSRGCGCEKIFKNYSSRVDYSHGNHYYNQNHLPYNGNSYNHRVITGANNNFYSAREQNERLEAEKIVNTFISKLERSGHTHNEIVRATQRIINRLEDIRTTTSKQKILIKYLKQELRSYEREYEDSYDKIYDVFEYYY